MLHPVGLWEALLCATTLFSCHRDKSGHGQTWRGDDYLSHHKGAVPLAARRTFSFMKRDPVRDTTHRSSWAEPAAPGPRRDISSRCAKARGEAAPSLKSSADSSCASKVLHEGASRKTTPHHHITWKATLSQTASVKGHSSQLEYWSREHDRGKKQL